MGVSPRLIGPLAALMLTCGCVLTQPHLMFHKTSQPPASVVATWSNRVSYVPDPANNGVPTAGLAGRVYFFTETPTYPISADGSIVVDLYDDTPRNGQSASVHLEQWRFDPATLSRLYKKDMIGMGYTLFLPWGTYRTDIKNIHLAVKFEPTTGVPLYAPVSPLVVEHTPPPTGVMPITK
jgi:hypothetical protein